MVRMILAAIAAVALIAGCSEQASEPGEGGKPLHAPPTFDTSLPGWVACSRLIVEGNVVRVSDGASPGRMLTEFAVERWIKPASGPKLATIETADIAAQGAYERWKAGTHLLLHVDLDPDALPNWQFNNRDIQKIEGAVPESRAPECPYGPA
jgi:hypothetical protein